MLETLLVFVKIVTKDFSDVVSCHFRKWLQLYLFVIIVEVIGAVYVCWGISLNKVPEIESLWGSFIVGFLLFGFSGTVILLVLFSIGACLSVSWFYIEARYSRAKRYIKQIWERSKAKEVN